MEDTGLFSPFRLGPLDLPNRIVMAPLTRSRALDGFVPGPLAVEYYGQRASAGLIIAEATQISQQGQGYQDTPGIYTDAQVAGWRRVTDRVRERGGRMFLQLWHVGRISHTSLQPGGAAPVAPSAVRANAQTFIGGKLTDVSEPRALRRDEIPGLIDDYRRAAANALAAGFDGVEVHGANGYLLDEFARDGANRRDDDYGGSIENRARLMLDVASAVAAEVGAGRTGIRISPVSPANDLSDSDPQALFEHIAAGLDTLGLAYLHVIEGATRGDPYHKPFDYGALRRLFTNAYMANNGYTRERAQEAVAVGRADLVAFGRAYIANPDLVERLRLDAPLNEPDVATFYGGGAEGYTDYPMLEDAAA